MALLSWSLCPSTRLNPPVFLTEFIALPPAWFKGLIRGTSIVTASDLAEAF